MYNKTNFRIASLAPGDQRYYLNGIHITEDFTEVTNGHYLMRVDSVKKGEHDDLPEREGLKPDKSEINCTIGAKVSKEIEKAIPIYRKVSSLPILQHSWIVQNGVENGQVKFMTTDLEQDKVITADKIDGKFPSSDKVLADAKKEKVVAEISFNAEYMMKLCEQFKKAEIKKVRLTIHGETKAMELKGENIDEQQKIKALLMPMQD